MDVFCQEGEMARTMSRKITLTVKLTKFLKLTKLTKEKRGHQLESQIAIRLPQELIQIWTDLGWEMWSEFKMLVFLGL